MVAVLPLFNIFLVYRIDLILAIAVVVGAGVITTRYMRRHHGPDRLSRRIWLLVVAIVIVGGLAAEWAAFEQVEHLKRMMSGFGPTFASEMRLLGHEYVTLETPPDDPRYLTMIEAEKRWLNHNAVVADIYTFRRGADGKVRLIVDSETDYNHNGVYDEEREQRTPIGEVYDETTPALMAALDGVAQFDATIISDRWGVWVSSFTPIYDRQGHVDGVLGIDYPAQSWLVAIAGTRAIVLLAALVLAAILLANSAFVALLSEEVKQRRAAQERLQQASDSALAASAAKSEFIAVTSHEVRTPLTAIMGFASILADTKLDPTQRRYLDIMSTAGERLMDLLNGILDYSRFESGKVEMDRVPWAPALLIHEVMQTMSAQAIQHGLALNFDNQLPGALTLRGDERRVRQVLLNLLGNAMKFTRIGGITVRAVWCPSSGTTATGQLTVGVADTGVGIPADKFPHLFQAFSQVNSATNRKEVGTGLGLAISRRLALIMGGELTATSEVGVGSTFTVTLPGELVEIGGPVTAARRNATVPAVPNWGRALVVDDQRLNRELLKVLLRRLGLDADLASSGPEAAAAASKVRYAIIFTDLEMPEMDGFTTAAQIRATEPPGQRVPIVAISALTCKGTRERCIVSGMDEYLTKPIFLPAMQSALAALFPANAAGGPPPSPAPTAPQPEAALA